MHRIARLLIAAIPASLVLAAILAAPAAASNCTRIYEDAAGGGDSYLTCVSIGNLYYTTHTQAGRCNTGALQYNDSWNDCVSSIYVNIDPGCWVAIYRDAQYGNLMYRFYDGDDGLYDLQGFNYNDVMTSIQIHCGL